MKKQISEQIANIKEALKKDAVEARKDKANRVAISKLQKTERDLVDLIDQYEDDLKEIQKEIAERISRVYDFSDPMTTKAVKATLRKLIKDNK